MRRFSKYAAALCVASLLRLLGCTPAVAQALIEPTPPMGYNSWLYGFTALYPGDPNGYLPNETRMHAQADALVSTGLAALGYTLMSVDAGWNANPRDPSGALTNNPTGFPSGMAALGTYFHSRGLLYGLYGAPGTLDCINWPAQYGHEAGDAAALAGWGVDYWKNDLCSATNQWGSSDANVQAAFQAMGTALANSGRPIAYHVNAYSANNSVAWGAAVHGTSVRIGSDNDNVQWYKKAQSLEGELWDTWRGSQHKGYWLDPDVLMFQLNENNNGNGSTPEIVGDVEARSQFNWYALIASPLLIGTDVTVLNSASLTTLRNTEVIAVDQDSLGLMGYRVASSTCGSATCAVWVRQLSDGWAVGFFNFDHSAAHDVSASWASFGVGGTAFAMRDLWAHSSLGSSSSGYTATAVPAMGSVVLKLTPPRFGAQGMAGQGIRIQ